MGIRSVSGFLRIISFFFSLNGIIFQLAECGPNGASPTACGDMTPQHGFPAMTSSPPYSLTIQTNNGIVNQGDMLQLSLSSSNIGFKGFLVLAFDASNPLADISDNLGSFLPSDSNSQVLNCENHYSGITHTNPNVKKSITFYWIAPENFTGSVAFKMSVVQNFSTIWVGTFSQSRATVIAFDSTASTVIDPGSTAVTVGSTAVNPTSSMSTSHSPFTVPNSSTSTQIQMANVLFAMMTAIWLTKP